MTATAQPFLTRHTVHLLTIAGPAVALAVFAAAADIRARARHARPLPFTPHRALRLAAAAAALVATAVHVWVAPEHFHEALVFGAFFTLTAACQLGWTVLLLARPRRWLVAAGCLGNAAVVALWTYTRVVAVPLGPDAGHPETIGLQDVIATTAELILVLITARMLVHVRTRTKSLDATHPKPAATARTA